MNSRGHGLVASGGPAQTALIACAFLLALLCAYWPCLSGQPIWDDDAHLTRADLRSVDGLRRIWTDVHATQQYYPVLHTAFWVEHRLWGDANVGYHLVNVTLHSLAAALLVALGARLGVRLAWIGGALFALHPVMVESVAWISEQKNTLSTLFYLAAALAFLSFQEQRSRRWYSLGTIAFALALLSKSVTATLPAALLVISWWRRGRLSWRGDVRPLLPWVAMAGGMACVTIWVEQSVVGAVGETWSLSLSERILISGRASWFYLGKLVWPAGLTFIYPRWELDTGSAFHWLFPVSGVFAIIGLWMNRHRARAPLAFALLFVGSVFPALGFFSVYPFRYSFVADHFQHLGAMWLFVGAATGATFIVRRLRTSFAVRAAAACVVIGVLGVVSRLHARDFRSARSLYASILEKDPGSFFAHHSLGMLLVAEGHPDQALGHFRAALAREDSTPEIWFGLGLALSHADRLEEAAAAYEKGFRIGGGLTDAESNYGDVLRRLGRVDEAIQHLTKVLAVDPAHGAARHNLGLALAQSGRWDAAVSELTEAAVRQPSRAATWLALGRALAAVHRQGEAIAAFARAVELDPGSSEAEHLLGVTLAVGGRVTEALDHLRAARRLDPENVRIQLDLAVTVLDSGGWAEAGQELAAVLRVAPDSALAHDRLGVALSRQSRFEEALAHFQDAVRISPADAGFRYDLAVALARAQRRSEAMEQLRTALALQPSNAMARGFLERLERR